MEFSSSYYRSDRLSSSVFPRSQRWSQFTPTTTPSHPSSHPPDATTAAGAASSATARSQAIPPCRDESTPDDSPRAYRTSSLRHLNGATSTKPLSAGRNSSSRQQPGPFSSSSTAASQPVLVRTYSGGPHDPPAGSSSKMPSSRRSFPFKGRTGSNASQKQRQGPPLPSCEDFSIDGILRAIEPNIRGTLDSIGEICGRSKLSLANEYGSHIAPLGEIRAPPGGLLTVEEASSDHEPQHDNVVIYDDENGVVDGRDPHMAFSQYEYQDHLRHAPVGHRQPVISLPRDGSNRDSARAMELNPAAPPVSAAADSMPTTRDIPSRPKSSGRALLQKIESAPGDQRERILTPAVVSEVLLDAQADGQQDAPAPLRVHASGMFDYDPVQNRWVPSAELAQPEGGADVQSLFGWLNHTRDERMEGSLAEQTAEIRLRAMLERQ